MGEQPKKNLAIFFVAAVLLAGMAGCAQIKKPVPATAAFGSFFVQSGRVSLYVGEPCTPQIMFDFQGARSTVLLAASRHETEVLTAAANKHQRVHISGKWRHGAQSTCSYVQVTSAELEK